MTTLDRSTFDPIQLRQFSGMQPAPIPSPERVEALRAEVAAHRAARPVMPWPLPPPGSPERDAWDRAMAAWVTEKDRLASMLEQAEGFLRSAWRPCTPPAHALNPAQPAEAVSAAPARRRRTPRAAVEPPATDESAEAAAPPRIGRPPLLDTDDPKVLKRRAQYRASAAKQQARRVAQRSGVIR